MPKTEFKKLIIELVLTNQAGQRRLFMVKYRQAIQQYYNKLI